MCYSEARDLFALSSLCRETRSIFVSKAFWKNKFNFLGIRDQQPSLEVYLRYLKLEKKFLVRDRCKPIYFNKLNLEELEKLDKSGVEEYKKILLKSNRKARGAERAIKEKNLYLQHRLLSELRSLPLYSLSIERGGNTYTILRKRETSNHKVTGIPILQGLGKQEMLNALLVLYDTS